MDLQLFVVGHMHVGSLASFQSHKTISGFLEVNFAWDGGCIKACGIYIRKFRDETSNNNVKCGNKWSIECCFETLRICLSGSSEDGCRVGVTHCLVVAYGWVDNGFRVFIYVSYFSRWVRAIWVQVLGTYGIKLFQFLYQLIQDKLGLICLL